MEINLPFKRLGTGKNKVREMYNLSEIAHGAGLMVNTDRIFTEDVVMLTGIPDKGKVLIRISAMIFRTTKKLVQIILSRIILRNFPKKSDENLRPIKRIFWTDQC